MINAAIGTYLPMLAPPLDIQVNAKIKNAMKSQTCYLAMPHTNSPRKSNKAGICAASLNARCAAEQTKTLPKHSPTITITPSQVSKVPKLDDGGRGLPPRDGGGGGGGGGGGSSSSGGFFLFGFLLFLSYLKDKEEDSRNY